MYCNNCGLEIDPEDFFCCGCGKRIKNKPYTEYPEYKINSFEFEASASRKPDYTKTIIPVFNFLKIPAGNFVLKGIWIIVLICVLGVFLTTYSIFVFDSGKHADVGDLNLQDRVQTDKNIRLCGQIAADYCNSHTYSKDDVYDCDNMAQDIWNMLKAKGVNARIAVGYIESAGDSKNANGNTHKDSDSGILGQIETPNLTCETTNLLNSSVIESFNHAWVLAEVSPGSWLAIECTAGYTVYIDENEKYYQGLTFSNPRNYRSFLSLYRDWKAKSLDYENERIYYNELICSYNNASSSRQSPMESGIKVAQRELQEKEKAFLKIDSELNALLKYG